jgi:RHS repeat-associated protein
MAVADRPDGGAAEPRQMTTAPPAIALPKGGGAIRGIGEKFAANPVTGTGSLSVSIPTSPGRSGFGPQLALSYDSGGGNGPFGFGWQLSLPSITRKTDKGLPSYRDEEESDVFVLSGVEDLVPVLDPESGWSRVRLDEPGYAPGYRVDRYRPRVEGLFARIERWTRKADGDTHWRSITRDNITTLYGKDEGSRIQDGGGPAARVFSWLISESYDDKGNAVVYTYKPEDDDGVDLAAAHERNRTTTGRSTNRYVKSVRYGNRVSRLLDPGLSNPGWMFEVVFDYGEHDPAQPTPGDTGAWHRRDDQFSSYRAGFEVRTYRLCQRVLLFHHFPADPDVGPDCLVRSMELTYRNDSVASFITLIGQAGYRRTTTGYSAKPLPPLKLGYSEATISQDLRFIDAASLENLPWVGGAAYQWVDLDGEGVSGVLTEQAGAWLYKPGAGEGRFGAVELVAATPSTAAVGGGRHQLLDLAGDGQVDLVELEGPTPGFTERTAEGGWAPPVPFRSLPNLAWDDPNLRFVDLSGDGHADVLVTEDEALVWYPSLGEDGFGPAVRVGNPADEEAGPRLVFADGEASVYLADMSGDGLPDLVRIRDGEVCYWPNLGYGRFGAKVAMDDAPRFDHPERFEQRRVRVADIDGSGTTDLVYLGADGVDVWFNQAGNGWSAPRRLAQLPPVDDVSAVAPVDLLGNGTACLVWSSPLPGDAGRPLRYVDLMGGQKPHLLTSISNNLGAETVVTYAPSTRFYLADKAAGRPWATRLPFPVHVVERVDTYDRVSGNRFTTRYAYHHGHFDGMEREFRGFAMVEQWDTEEYMALAAGLPATNLDAASHVPPVLTRTWYHTGAYQGGEQISRALAHEYHGAPRPDGPDAATRWAAFEATLLPDTVLEPATPELSADELRGACRALKGAVLRQEVCALDGGERAGRPYTVSERTYAVRRLQPQAANQHAVFLTHPREELVAHHERARYAVGGELVADPRVTQTLTLDVDDFGNVLASAAIAYGRRHDDPDPLLTEADRATQRAPLVTYTENRFTDPVLASAGPAPPDDACRAPLPCETRTWELTGPDLAASGRIGFDDVLAAVAAAVPLDYEQAPTGGSLEKRLIKHDRTRYRADDLTGLLPLGRLEPLALPGQSERCAFTPGLVAQVYSTRVSDAMLADAGYVHSDGDTAWWIPSGVSYLSPTPADPAAQELAWARRHFFLPHRFSDPFGNVATVAYDDDNLLVARTSDRVGNTVSAVNDYRALQPAEVTDPNRNRRAVQFDELGMVTATAVMSKVGETDPEAMGDTLADPTTRLEYGLFEWVDHGRPAFVRTLARERHRAPDTRWQETWAYWDGFGRELQRKALAEPGPLLPGGPTVQRWVGGGWVLYNNKGKPVRRYEPFFSATSAFEVSQQGVGATLGHDPVGRVVATLHPDHTWERVVLDPWRQATWDANDTVLAADPADDPDVGELFGRLPQALYLPTWHAQRAGGALGAREQAAASKAAAHANTPAVAQLDTLGRVFLTVADNGGGKRYLTRVRLDIEGNTRAVTDARGVVTSFDYDMLGNAVRSTSADAGTRRTLANVLGKPIHGWDDRGFARHTVYDAEQRPTELHVDDGTISRLAERTVYGEAQGDAANHRGRVFQVFDGAGLVTTTVYDFKGNPRSTTRQLLRDYRGPADWSANPALQTKVFAASTTYDALNRPETTTTDDGSVIRPGYNEAGLLETLTANLRGAAASTTFLSDVDYNAKGQRALAVYPVTDGGAASSVRTTYHYDQRRFRLIGLTTTRATDSRRLQDLAYAYDPVGNVTAIGDDALPTVFYDNQQVTADGDYTYDALYRLVEATGREHDGSGAVDLPDNFPQRKPHYDSDDWTRRGKTHPNDKSALRRYTEIYAYDGAGNIVGVTHRAAGGGAWTRRYEYAAASNRLLGTSLPGDPDGTFSARYAYDLHGNTVSMPHLPTMAWDADDRLHMTQRQVVTAGVGERTWHVYDAAGQRVRKVTELQNGTIKDERIYLGGYEVYRAYNGSGSVDLERETLHVMDDTRRVALVETLIRKNGSVVAAPQPVVRYQFGDHLGSATLELDEHGEIISYEEYHPYGSTAYQAGRSVAEVSLKRYRFTGMERDEESGLCYHGARYYAPWLGRWTSCDPAGMADGPSLYHYARDNPLARVDVTGGESDLARAAEILRRHNEQAPQDYAIRDEAAAARHAAQTGDMAAATRHERVWKAELRRHADEGMKIAFLGWAFMGLMIASGVAGGLAGGAVLTALGGGAQASFGVKALAAGFGGFVGGSVDVGGEQTIRLVVGERLLSEGEVGVRVASSTAIPVVFEAASAGISRLLSRLPKPGLPTGAGSAAELDAWAEGVYGKVRQYAASEIRSVARNTGFSQGQVKLVHEHLFLTEHALPVGPGQIAKMRFTADPHVAELWTKALAGKLDVEELRQFGRLMLHEQAESGLMSRGMPYRSADPAAWVKGYNAPVPSAYGAHDLAPKVGGEDPFSHWLNLFRIGSR